MSDPSDQTPTPSPADEPVTVVGYPDQPGAPAPQTVPGMAGVRMAISSVRAIAVISLVLVLVLTAGVVIGIVAVRGQISDLSAQVSELSEQQVAQEAAVAQPAPQPTEQAQQSQAAQLPAAPELPDAVPLPEGVEVDGSIAIGDPNASNVVEVYVDYQCPYCQRWELEIGTVLAERALQPDSDLLIKQYNLAFLGEQSATLDPPGPSARAASAAACVLEGEGPEGFTAFNAEVFSQPDSSEPATQFATELLTGIASELGASSETVACIDEGRHIPFVAASTQNGFGRGVQGTPTVIVNGRTVENSFADNELIGLALG
ncbi:MAG TPA: thioredoxin domain-containing protein [Candidatus Nanopelagicales bacterium]|nr:thioredoxin domain-containing protein [Candidatus Nanopelagicales bacterium]